VVHGLDAQRAVALLRGQLHEMPAVIQTDHFRFLSYAEAVRLGSQIRRTVLNDPPAGRP
jgi:hypothetical protein